MAGVRFSMQAADRIATVVKRAEREMPSVSGERVHRNQQKRKTVVVHNSLAEPIPYGGVVSIIEQSHNKGVVAKVVDPELVSFGVASSVISPNARGGVYTGGVREVLVTNDVWLGVIEENQYFQVVEGQYHVEMGDKPHFVFMKKSNRENYIWADVTRQGLGEFVIEKVLNLPPIPTFGAKLVFWTSEGAGTGDDQIWGAFAGQVRWYPMQFFVYYASTFYTLPTDVPRGSIGYVGSAYGLD